MEEEETELDTLLKDITEEAEDNDRRLALDRDEATLREERLVARGESIRRMAMERRRQQKTTSEPKRGEPAGEQSDEEAGVLPGGDRLSTEQPGCAEIMREKTNDVQGTARGGHAAPHPKSGASPSPNKGRKRVIPDDHDDIVEALERSEARRTEVAQKKLDLAERRLEQERVLRAEDAERRDRQDKEQCEERAAQLRLIDALVRKLG